MLLRHKHHHRHRELQEESWAVTHEPHWLVTTGFCSAVCAAHSAPLPEHGSTKTGLGAPCLSTPSPRSPEPGPASQKGEKTGFSQLEGILFCLYSSFRRFCVLQGLGAGDRALSASQQLVHNSLTVDTCEYVCVHAHVCSVCPAAPLSFVFSGLGAQHWGHMCKCVVNVCALECAHA